MHALFWIAFVLGGGLLALSMLGDILDADSDVDVDADGVNLTQILSLRNLTYFLFGFGAAGVLLGWLWDGGRLPLITATAVATGLIASGVSALAFGYVRSTESGDLPSDETFEGLLGEVTLPITSGGTGRVRVVRSGREHEFLARPFDEGVNDTESWESVVVVRLEEGIALVTPFSELERA